MTEITQLTIVSLLAFFALWQKQPFLYIISAMVSVGYGIYLTSQGGSPYIYEGAGMILFGLFCLYEVTRMFIGRD